MTSLPSIFCYCTSTIHNTQYWEMRRRRRSSHTSSLLAWVDLVISGISALHGMEKNYRFSGCQSRLWTPERQQENAEKMMSNFINSFRCSMINEVQELLQKLFIALVLMALKIFYSVLFVSFHYRFDVVYLCEMWWSPNNTAWNRAKTRVTQFYIIKRGIRGKGKNSWNERREYETFKFRKKS